MKKRSSVFLIGAACAVCCASLLAPLLGTAGIAGFGAAGVGLLAGVGVEEIVCIAIIAALAVFAGLWALQARAASKKRLMEGAACAVGGVCDPHARAKPD